METTILQRLYHFWAGQDPEKITMLQGAGSNRKYYRIEGAIPAIGVIGTSQEENLAFIHLAQHFYEKGLPVPELYAYSGNAVGYLQEDLGDTSLFDAIQNGRERAQYSAEEEELLCKAIRWLPKIQHLGAEGLNFTKCYPQAEFDRRTVQWDLNYFKYCFLKASGLNFREDYLENEFDTLAKKLLREKRDTFMYRDFQSRNIMLREGEPYFIDFQGGRRGPIYYDVASFLWQAKARFPQDLKDRLLAAYLKELAKYQRIHPKDFKMRLRHFILFRTLQTLGTYGFRGYFEQKMHFIQSIPYAIANLKEVLALRLEEYPYICKVLKELMVMDKFQLPEDSKKLRVVITSFSYKRGIPADLSGNGGGFVFDCRALPNPGRYPEYAGLTGLDQPVIDFLRACPEVEFFLHNSFQLVKASVKRYIERGFNRLMVSFGCTGGQHRSVYCAQQMAAYLRDRYNVNIDIVHREQNTEEN